MGTPIDRERYELHLSQARSLHLAVVQFDPQKHPRGLKGRFAKTVADLRPGEKVQLPGGASVRRARDGDGFHVHPGDHMGRGVSLPKTASPEKAASAALASSARSKHPDSLGGGVQHNVSPQSSPAEFDKLGGDTIDVGADVNKAADLLAQGKKVQLDQPRTASVLLDHLAKLVNEAKAAGAKAPNYDLCKVTVPGTNLFCAESKGIPRIKMPQLGGIPTPGSKADKLPKNDKGEVNLTQQFRDHVTKELGATIADEKEKASFLRASQIELNGAKVAGMVSVLSSGKKLGGDPRIFVSHDNYIVDGHHRWAAHVGHDLEDGKLHDVDMDVARVSMDIIPLLDAANKFAAEMGIPQAAV